MKLSNVFKLYLYSAAFFGVFFLVTANDFALLKKISILDSLINLPMQSEKTFIVSKSLSGKAEKTFVIETDTLFRRVTGFGQDLYLCHEFMSLTQKKSDGHCAYVENFSPAGSGWIFKNGSYTSSLKISETKFYRRIGYFKSFAWSPSADQPPIDTGWYTIYSHK